DRAPRDSVGAPLNGSGLDSRGIDPGGRGSGMWSERGGGAAAYCTGDGVSHQALAQSLAHRDEAGQFGADDLAVAAAQNTRRR
ncbi:unnamed protein product, partial [Urochloa humidicola]